MSVRAVDVHGFGGGFTLGAVQAGWDLVGKKSREVGFGVLNCLANRDLLGSDWESQADVPAMWTLEDDVQLVFGNPPCSGFSTLSPKHFRGQDSAVNDYMWEFVGYAARQKPEIAIFESVQQTFSQGRPLMQRLRERLEEVSGLKYDLYHVLHTNAALGGASIRKRYFWVASRVPFEIESCGVDRSGEPYDVDRAPLIMDVIGDLAPLHITMHRQPYAGVQIETETHSAYGDIVTWTERNISVMQSSFWTRREAHDGTGTVDGHDVARSPTYDRIVELMELEEWRQGDRMSDVLRRLYERTGDLPMSWHYPTKKTDPVTGERVTLPKVRRLVETDFAMGHNQPVRWRESRIARVLTGGAVHLIVHPTLPRTLTQREAARIQGFPDEWSIFPVRRAPDLGPGWGKGVPVHAGRWVAWWAKRAVLGEARSPSGSLIGDRERLVQLTADYKPLARAVGDPG